MDAVASMLYLDYGREQGAGCPTRRRPGKTEAVTLIRKINSACSPTSRRDDVAEESTTWPLVTKPPMRGAGLHFKWNMGWMNDTLFYFSLDPVYRLTITTS